MNTSYHDLSLNWATCIKVCLEPMTHLSWSPYYYQRITANKVVRLIQLQTCFIHTTIKSFKSFYCEVTLQEMCFLWELLGEGSLLWVSCSCLMSVQPGGGTGCGGPGPTPEQVHRQHDSAQTCQWKNGLSQVSSHLYTSCKSSTQWLEANRSQVTTTHLWIQVGRCEFELKKLLIQTISWSKRIGKYFDNQPKHWFSQSKRRHFMASIVVLGASGELVLIIF